LRWRRSSFFMDARTFAGDTMTAMADPDRPREPRPFKRRGRSIPHRTPIDNHATASLRHRCRAYHELRLAVRG
jgi:hypothetical protein